jgi:UDPglucose 6-dehydrogenase
MKIGVMGYGVVGNALTTTLRDEGYEVAVYDPYKGFDDTSALAGCDIVFVCVWTPMRGERLDQSAVFEAVALAARTVPEALIVVRSTILPGTMTALANTYPKQRLAFVPEFLVEADPIGSSRRTDRIVVGAKNEPELVEIMQRISPEAPVVVMEPEAAVLVKLCSNGMLASKVAIAHEMALICEAYDVDWETVKFGVGLDHRIGPDHMSLNGEGGYGGSCFPKDMWGIVEAAKNHGVEPLILETIQRANIRRRAAVSSMAEAVTK